MSTNERCEVSASTGTLHDYNTAEPIRAASDDELRGSVHTAEHDSGAGVHSPRSRRPSVEATTSSQHAGDGRSEHDTGPMEKGRATPQPDSGSVGVGDCKAKNYEVVARQAVWSASF